MVKTFRHQEKMLVSCDDAMLYQIVKDVEHYPDFLPWCLSARIIERGDSFFIADLLVGFSSVKETFRSRVGFDDAKKSITTDGHSKGPLRTMTSHWQFTAIAPKKTEVIFTVEFQFSSLITEKLFAPFFGKAIEKMSSAFLTRTKEMVKP